ncbi:MAG: hypothetical protein Unbinned1529contig1001_44 [Prokaryotic dsDNA virus sp.]|nr:MAG: hypothetical protein Unbinned1529contig1001_44 [Prokaryotic dsDNA virus sp.]
MTPQQVWELSDNLKRTLRDGVTEHFYEDPLTVGPLVASFHRSLTTDERIRIRQEIQRLDEHRTRLERNLDSKGDLDSPHPQVVRQNYYNGS